MFAGLMIPAIVLRVLPFVLCVLTGLATGYKLTADHYRSAIAKRDLAAAAELSKAQQRVIEAVQEQQVITNQVASDYEQKIAEIRAKYADVAGVNADSGLRNKPAPARRVRAVPNAASKPNAAAPSDGLSTELRLAAELQTQQLISLQEWIRKQQAEHK